MKTDTKAFDSIARGINMDKKEREIEEIPLKPRKSKRNELFYSSCPSPSPQSS